MFNIYTPRIHANMKIPDSEVKLVIHVILDKGEKGGLGSEILKEVGNL